MDSDPDKSEFRTLLRNLGILLLVLVFLAVAVCIWIVISIYSGDMTIPEFFKDGIHIPPINNPVGKVF